MLQSRQTVLQHSRELPVSLFFEPLFDWQLIPTEMGQVPVMKLIMIALKLSEKFPVKVDSNERKMEPVVGQFSFSEKRPRNAEKGLDNEQNIKCNWLKMIQTASIRINQNGFNPITQEGDYKLTQSWQEWQENGTWIALNVIKQFENLFDSTIVDFKRMKSWYRMSTKIKTILNGNDWSDRKWWVRFAPKIILNMKGNSMKMIWNCIETIKELVRLIQFTAFR